MPVLAATQTAAINSRKIVLLTTRKEDARFDQQLGQIVAPVQQIEFVEVTATTRPRSESAAVQRAG
jgi:hypothetical protein